jgi:hypothetical protein
MKSIIGMVLIAVGIVGLVWGGLTYTTRETVVDIGPIQATRDKQNTLPLPPMAGAAALAGGIFLLVSGRK